MKRIPKPLWLVAILGLCAVFVWHARNSDAKIRQLSNALGSLRDSSERKSAGQRHEHAGLADNPQVPRTELGNGAALTSDEELPLGKPEGAFTANEVLAAPEVTAEDILAHMESEFEAQVSGGQARDTAMAIESFARSTLDSRARIKSLTCRASMCRLDTVQPDEQSYQTFAYQMTHSDLCKDCFYTQTGETSEGGRILTVFMAREGASLPRLE